MQRDAVCVADGLSLAVRVAISQPVRIAFGIPQHGAVAVPDPNTDASGIAPSGIAPSAIPVTASGITQAKPVGVERERQPIPRQR